MSRLLSLRFPLVLIGSLFAILPMQNQAQVATTGQTGLINMPDGRIGEDGEFRSGYSVTRPYSATWISLSILPRVEGSFRYTRIAGLKPFEGPGSDYGDYKDKSFDFKALLIEEKAGWPSLVIGKQDLQGTLLFPANYIALSKKIHESVDVTVGYGNKRIDGLFGGVRIQGSGPLKNWGLVAEYDAYNYARDPFTSVTNVAGRQKTWHTAVEYLTPIGLRLQVGEQYGKGTLNAYFRIPLNEREYLPKSEEPAAYQPTQPRPTLEEWRNDSRYTRSLVRALGQDDFRAIRLNYRHGKLTASLTNVRISQSSRAVGRAARIMLAHAPLDAREMEITYTVQNLPVATYRFNDLNKLQQYFNGLVTRSELAKTISLDYAQPTANQIDNELAAVLAASDDVKTPLAFRRQDEGNLISLRTNDNQLNRFSLAPAISGFFNDPSGSFKYEVAAQAGYDARLAPHTSLTLATRLMIVENITDVKQPSNSVLPHVRTDVAQYKKGNDFKLHRAAINQFYQPSERVYARATAGIYEEMFSGVGGQVLYVPRGARWSTDVAIDALKQRDYQGWLGHRDYSVVTAIGSLHWRINDEITTTLRAGQFLARDKGARLEFKRRFLSGIQIGAYYTLTDGKDITTPGSPGNPYRDKGVLFSIPLAPLTKRDTQQVGSFTLQPWTRDVGQMVAAPVDLYQVYERSLIRDLHQGDGLHQFGDIEDDYPKMVSPLAR
ncbi:YjbH domain-containing protein [Parvibium lacunae]|nr:YjbH domain-containing protein [Parvibium lacunae]